MCIVMVRRMFVEDEHAALWPELSDAGKANAAPGAARALLSASHPALMEKVADATACIVGIGLQDGLWPEFIPAMMDLVAGNAAPLLAFAQQRADSVALDMSALQNAALKVLEQLSMALVQGAPELRVRAIQLYNAAMLDSSSSNATRVSAAKAAGTLAVATDRNASAVAQLAALAPAIIQLITHFSAAAAVEQLRSVLAVACDVAEAQPAFYKHVLPDMLRLMLSLADDSRVKQSIRLQALEWVITFAESSPAMARRLPDNQYLRHSLPVVLQLMLDCEDPQWASREESETGDPRSGATAGGHAVSRLATSIGGRRFLPLLIKLNGPFLRHTDWRYRFAGMWALAMSLDSLPVETPASELRGITAGVLQHITDEAPRVRYAAVHAVGMLAYYFKPETQLATTDIALPALQAALGDPVQRVAAHAAGSLVNFVAGFDGVNETQMPADLSNYVHGLLAALLGLLQRGGRTAKEWSLSAISALAQLSEEQLAQYYDQLMPELLSVVTTTPEALSSAGADLRDLRGRAVEAMATLASAAGRDKFMPDAQTVVAAFLDAAAASADDADDPLPGYLWPAWGRLAKVLGGETLAPVLPRIIPAMLQCITVADDSVVIVRGDAADALRESWDDSDEDEDDVYQHHELEDGGIARVRTSALEDKGTAIHALSELAQFCGVSFAPLIEQVMPALHAVLAKGEYGLYDDVRGYAMECLTHMASTARKAVEAAGPGASRAPLQAQLVASLSALLLALKDESNTSMAGSCLAAIRACIENACRVRATNVHGAAASVAPLTSATSPVRSPVPPQAEAAAASPVTSPAATGSSTATSQQVTLHDGTLVYDSSPAPGIQDGPYFAPLLSEPVLQEVTAMAVRALEQSHARCATATQDAKLGGDDWDDEAYEMLAGTLAEEEMVQSAVMEVLGVLLKVHRGQFWPIVATRVAPLFDRMLAEGSSEGTRRAAVFIICDILEFVGDAAAASMPQFLQQLLHAAQTAEGSSLAQAAVYGVGAAATGAGRAAFAPFAGSAATMLTSVVLKLGDSSTPKSMRSVRDNAVCALLKVLHYTDASVPDAVAVPAAKAAMEAMPLLDDCIEGRVAAGLLCARVNAQDARFIGTDATGLAAALVPLGRTLAIPALCTLETSAAVSHAVRDLQSRGVWAAVQPVLADDVASVLLKAAADTNL